MKKLRSLHVCLAYPPNENAGGVATAARALADAFAASGHRVEVIAPKLTGARFQRPRFLGETTDGGAIHIRFLGTWLQFGFKTVNPAALFLLPWLALRSDVVVIHGLRTFCGTIAALACMLLRKRYVVLPHGMAVPRWRSLGKKHLYDAVLGNAILRHAARIVCLSSTEQEEILDLTGRSADSVPVIDAGSFEDAPSALGEPASWEKARIVLLGRLVPEKGFDLVIDAVARQGLHSKYEIWIVGPEEDKNYAANLRLQAGRAGVRVHFTGPLYGADRDGVIMESHLLALVSEYESYGLAALEALRLGTPALVSDSCGIARDLDRPGALVVKRSAASIGNSLEELAAGGFKALRALRDACRARASQSPVESPDARESVVASVVAGLR